MKGITRVHGLVREMKLRMVLNCGVVLQDLCSAVETQERLSQNEERVGLLFASSVYFLEYEHQHPDVRFEHCDSNACCSLRIRERNMSIKSSMYEMKDS